MKNLKNPLTFEAQLPPLPSPPLPSPPLLLQSFVSAQLSFLTGLHLPLAPAGTVLLALPVLPERAHWMAVTTAWPQAMKPAIAL